MANITNTTANIIYGTRLPVTIGQSGGKNAPITKKANQFELANNRLVAHCLASINHQSNAPHTHTPISIEFNWNTSV